MKDRRAPVTSSRVFHNRARWQLAALLPLVLFSVVARAFVLQTLEEERVELSDYVGFGEWTLVMFWSTDCIPCEQQKPMIESFHSDHAGRGARVIGIVLDGIEGRAAIEAKLAGHDPGYPNLVVFTDVFHRQFRELTGKEFRATPTYLLYDPQGRLAGVRSGPIERKMLESIITP